MSDTDQYEIVADSDNERQRENVHFRKDAFLERIDGDEEILRMLMESSLDQLSNDVESLGRGVQACDPEAIKVHAHRIMGAALNMCFERLAEMARSIEGLPEDAVHEYAIQFQDIEREWAAVRGELATMSKPT